MFPPRYKSHTPSLPSGFVLRRNEIRSPEALNRLLSRCNEETYPSKRLALALENSAFYLSISHEESGRLVGFVRATSDKGLNANLWNLVAESGDKQKLILSVLVDRSLGILKREMPGCSVSVAAPSTAVQALTDKGFLIDPGGIRAMGLRIS